MVRIDLLEVIRPTDCVGVALDIQSVGWWVGQITESDF